MTVQEATTRLRSQLSTIYDEREAANISDLVMENITGWKRIDRIVKKQAALSTEQLQAFEQYTIELLAHKPLQYVLHEAWFFGMKLFVDEAVLVPRPETEELVQWIVESTNAALEATKARITILDIGTGSGCIPIALKKKLPQATLYACDISEKSLAIARRNALSQKAAIAFLSCNFLDAQQREKLPQSNIIVSNPPYIPSGEQAFMQANVTAFEPPLALFVPDENPLIFYEAIAAFGKTHLLEQGSIYVEIHEGFGEEVMAVFTKSGYKEVELKKDLQGKPRMVRAS